MTKQPDADDAKGLVDHSTGEIMQRAYDTTQHQGYAREVLNQYNYIHKTLRNEKDPDSFSRLDGDTLSMVLTELTAYYETAQKWLADEKLHLDDLKLARQFKYNDMYLQFKQRKSETNETARVQAQMLCHKEDEELNLVQHNYNRVTAWKKALGRWIDTCRTQLSWEKTIGNFTQHQQ